MSWIRDERTRAVGIGVVLAILTLLTLSQIDRQMTLELTTMLLVLIAAIYVGFALSDGRPRELAIEIVGAGGFVLMALLGLWVSPYWLVAGLFLHGIWDVLHRPTGIQTQVNRWYPPLCLVYDWLIAGYLLVWLL